MVALMREFPQVKLTFNLVPSLARAARSVCRGSRARLASRARAQAGRRAHRARSGDHALGVLSRAARRDDRSLPALCRAAAETRQRRRVHRCRFSRPAGLAQARVGRSVLSRQRSARASAASRSSAHFTEDDKLELREVELEILRRVIPEYRAAAERGQVELSTSPFYHPILPLLCDTDIYLRTHPAAAVPRPPFRHPEDAAEQLVAGARVPHAPVRPRTRRALAVRRLGVRCDGRAGGQGRISVDGDRRSDPRRGRSIASSGATARAGSRSPSRSIAPYAVQVRPSQIGCLFRDHSLSDLIGFVYAGWEADAAASDFVHRLAEAGRRFSAATGGEEATISIILDGENAWEHFEGGGRPFLRALYGKLSAHPELRTVTMTEAAAAPASNAERHLSGILDRRQLLHLDRPRRRSPRLAAASRCTPDVRPRSAGASRLRPRTGASRSCSLPKAATGSGGTATTIRPSTISSSTICSGGTSRNVYQMLGQPMPEELFVTNIRPARCRCRRSTPVGLLQSGARRPVDQLLRMAARGHRRNRRALGHDDRRRPARAGRQTAALRVRSREPLPAARPVGSAGQKLAEGLRCSVNFTMPADHRLVLFGTDRGPVADLHHADSGGQLGSGWCGIADSRGGRDSRSRVAVRRFGPPSRTTRSPSSSLSRTEGSSSNGTRPTGRSRASCPNQRSRSSTGRLRD